MDANPVEDERTPIVPTGDGRAVPGRWADPNRASPVRSIVRFLRQAKAPLVRWLRLHGGQSRIQRTARLSRADRSDKRRRYHVLVDLINEHFPAPGVRVAEVGTMGGGTARHLARYCPQIECVFAIDLDPPPAREGDDRVRFVKGWSDECAKQFDDESFELVFIDADHSEEWVLRDIAAWLPKVRPDGILAGHDYGSSRYPGVKKVVDRVFGTAPQRVHLEANKVWWVFR